MKELKKTAGRPKNNNKAYLIQCHPDCIKEVRLFAKEKSLKINNK